MVDIPDRENLESMSRTDIQKLCKDNNIKANMRTDEMISALCDLVNGKNVPRPHRSASVRAQSQPPPKSRLPSQGARNSVQPPASKLTETSTAKKAALQPSESNTDAESVADLPASAPTTRRKAKEIQVHLGKGRPAVAGGSGARNVTKTLSRGGGRKTKTSAMLQEAPILEEEEENEVEETPVDIKAETAEANKDNRPSSVRPLSLTRDAPSSSHDAQPSQLPTPVPSQLSYSLSSVQLTALDARVAKLENAGLATRILQIEAAMAELPVLQASVTQIPVLQAEVKRLEAANNGVKAELAQWTKAHAELHTQVIGLETHVTTLVAENEAMKGRVVKLEAKLRGEDDASMTSVIIHSPDDRKRTEGRSVEDAKVGASKKASSPTIVKPAVLPDPSPSQPTLGKRARSETPDISEVLEGNTQKKREDAELEAIYRVTRPQRKRARLELDRDEDVSLFPLFQRHRGGPSSTSTPQQRKSDSPPGFFTAGRRVPTPLAPRDDVDAYLQLEPDESRGDGDASELNAVAGPSNSSATSPIDAALHTPPARSLAMPGLVIPTDTEQRRAQSDILHDPNYFGGPLPVFYTQDSELPYPLHPSTPPNAQDILEQSAQYATPVLGEPWKYTGTVNPANISQMAEATAASGLRNPLASPSTPVLPGSPGRYTFRAGGRMERNDKYNPYFTPQRGPGARQRTGLTPTRGFSISLKSPAKMTTVAESAEAETNEEEDGVERSPPQLRTLYGTELEGDTRFGDYGRDLGRFDWGKYLTR